jgi:hypothetical protein
MDGRQHVRALVTDFRMTADCINTITINTTMTTATIATSSRLCLRIRSSGDDDRRPANP